MISMIFFYDKTGDMDFIHSSIICSTILENTTKIISQLLTEIEKEPLTPNNKSTVITCLMTSYLLKHLGLKEKFAEMVNCIKNNPKYRFSLIRIIKIGIQFFSERPCDSIDM